MYLKTFEDGNSRIRVLEDDPDKWMELKEHFDFGLKISYPCAIHEGFETCFGCSYAVEHEEWEDLDTHFPGLARSVQLDARKKADPGWGVRANPSKWIFPCIDAKGYIAIYKIGFTVWKDFKTKYDVLGSVTGTEFMVTRVGKGFDTTVGEAAEGVDFFAFIHGTVTHEGGGGENGFVFGEGGDACSAVDGYDHVRAVYGVFDTFT